MATSDPRDWGLLAGMVCAHGDRCARPRFIRGRIGWTPGLIDILGDTTGAMRRFLNGIYTIAPAIFGGRVVVCVTCNEMVFMGWVARKLYTAVRFFYTPEDESILFIDQDVERIGEFAESLDLDYVGD